MHSCIYVIIGPEGDIDTETRQALAPFDEGREVPRHKIRLERSGIRTMAEFYDLPEDDLPPLAKKLPDWLGAEGGVDNLGLFYWSQWNPDGKWDWYLIGGRWDGRILGRPSRHDPYDEDRAHHNVLTTDELLKAKDLANRLPAAIVTPVSEWLEQETYIRLSDRFGFYRREDDEWLKRVQTVLQTYARYRVVGVDIHY